MKTQPDYHEEATKRLVSHESRYTTARRQLVETLHKAKKPLAVSDILSRNKKAPISSAYRNLVVLEDAGVVKRITGSDEFARFELHEDLTGHHHHAVCKQCGDVVDLPGSPKIEAALDEAVKQARAAGFRDIEHRLDLVGLCSKCK